MKAIGLCLLLLLASVVATAEVCIPGPRPAAAMLTPVQQIQTLEGSNFDLTYMRAMYQLHSDVSAMATQALKRLSGKVLVKLSDRIRDEQDDQNAKLAEWYKQAAGTQIRAYCVESNSDYQRLQIVPAQQYDNQYANIIADYLNQASQASALAFVRATRPDLRYQAKLVYKAAVKEIQAIRDWQNNISVYE